MPLALRDNVNIFFNGIWGINSLLFYLIIFLVDLNGMLFLYVEFLAIILQKT